MQNLNKRYIFLKSGQLPIQQFQIQKNIQINIKNMLCCNTSYDSQHEIQGGDFNQKLKLYTSKQVESKILDQTYENDKNKQRKSIFYRQTLQNQNKIKQNEVDRNFKQQTANFIKLQKNIQYLQTQPENKFTKKSIPKFNSDQKVYNSQFHPYRTQFTFKQNQTTSSSQNKLYHSQNKQFYKSIRRQDILTPAQLKIALNSIKSTQQYRIGPNQIIHPSKIKQVFNEAYKSLKSRK